MSTLTTDTPRAYEQGDINEIGVAAHTIIYEGAAVGMQAGFARPLQAGDLFLGFCEQNTDNAKGNAGDQRVRLITCGRIRLPVANAVAADIGKPVYASDDNTFTLLKEANSFIGFITRLDNNGECIVAFDVNH